MSEDAASELFASQVYRRENIDALYLKIQHGEHDSF